MFDLKRVERVDNIAPDLIAMVNAPEALASRGNKKIPARGYIFNRNLKDFDEVKKISEHFIHSVNKLIHPGEEIYVIGFVYVNKARDFDMNLYLDKERKINTVFYPYELSSNGANLTKAEPFIAIEGGRQGWPVREKEDFHYILGEEAKHRRSLYQKLSSEEAFKAFINNPPEIPGLKYID